MVLLRSLLAVAVAMAAPVLPGQMAEKILPHYPLEALGGAELILGA